LHLSDGPHHQVLRGTEVIEGVSVPKNESFLLSAGNGGGQFFLWGKRDVLWRTWIIMDVAEINLPFS
ncbi:MAG TPA: hypothetical protein DEQ37_10855, partial [Clostridiales bacterium]|nr:hypothetical protein [Clostridiales bacterium]